MPCPAPYISLKTYHTLTQESWDDEISEEFSGWTIEDLRYVMQLGWGLEDGAKVIHWWNTGFGPAPNVQEPGYVHGKALVLNEEFNWPREPVDGFY